MTHYFNKIANISHSSFLLYILKKNTKEKQEPNKKSNIRLSTFLNLFIINIRVIVVIIKSEIVL